MSAAGDALAQRIVDSIGTLSEANKRVMLEVWKAIANELVSAVIPIGGIVAWHKTFGVADSGATTDAISYKLIQAGQNFLTTVDENMIVINTSDNTESYVVSVDSNTQLTLADNIMSVGKNYIIYKTPVLDEGFVECNGQVLSDLESPYDGETIPNLNGASSGADSPDIARKDKMFLRGCATEDGETSGTGEDDATAANGLTVDPNPHSHTFPMGQTDGAGNYADRATNYDADKTTVATTLTILGDTETRPINMSVVWVMRIK